MVDSKKVQKAFKEIYTALDEIRGSISVDKFIWVLPVLFLERDNCISKDDQKNEHLAGLIIERFEQYANDNPYFLEITQSLLIDFFDQLGNVRIALLLRQLRLSKINNLSQEEFRRVFDLLLQMFSEASGRNISVFSQPQELSELMVSLGEVKEDTKVYNPFAGTASIIPFLPNKTNYLGEEENRIRGVIGKMRIFAYGLEHQFKYRLTDSTAEWNLKNEQFDLIISNSLVIPRKNSLKKTIGQWAVEAFVFSQISALSTKGRAIILVWSHILIERSQQKLRQHLVKFDLLDMIISFPIGIIQHAHISLTLLVISKNKSQKEKVTFIDASKFTQKISRIKKLLNVKELIAFIQQINDGSLGTKGENFAKVSNTSITKHGYNLNVGRYLLPEIDGTALAELLTNISLKSSKEKYGKYISIKDLTDDFLNSRTSFENTLSEKIDTKYAVYELRQDALLVSRLGHKLRVAYFDFQGESIFISRSILTFSIDEQRIDAEYLIHELLSEYALFQLAQYSGETIQITGKSLKEVKIKLPSLHEQKAKVLGIKEVSDKIAKLQEERNALAHGLAVREFDEFASLKHTLATPRVRISSYMRRLIRKVENNPSTAFVQLNQEIKETLGEELIQIFKSIRKDAKFIGELLEKGETGLNLEEYKLSNIPISDITKHIKKSKNSYGFELVITPFDTKESKDVFFSANLTLLEILLQNIFTNAEKYAFDSNRKNKRVEVRLDILVDSILLTIKNNGKPFPKNYGRDQFIEKYSTADDKNGNGNGIGGYDINRIVEYFGGNWDLFLNEPVYPVRFEFQFPKKSKYFWI